MKTTFKICIAVVSVLLFIAVIGLVINMGPLFGQIHNDNWVPDMTGEWDSEGFGYHFNDVTDPEEEPLYFEGSGDRTLFITHQTGMAFAGTWEGRKLTGVILPDRTVSMQAFELSELHVFVTGKLIASGGKIEIQGYYHQFDDFHKYPENPDMWTLYGRLFKIN